MVTRACLAHIGVWSAVTSVVACATPRSGHESVAAPLAHDWTEPYPPKSPPRPGQIFHRATGRAMSVAEAIRYLSDFKVIYVAEAHNNLAAHQVQATIVHELEHSFPGEVAIGMEMFPVSAQPQLDRIERGEMAVPELRALWAEHWNIDIDYYWPIFDTALVHRIPVRGLNLPEQLIKKVSRQGLDALDAKERALLPESGPIDPYQRALLSAVFDAHQGGSGRLDRFMQVQSLWDESMAERAASYLQSEPGQGKRLIILAGGFHIEHGFGIPRRLFRRLPVSYAIVTPRLVEDTVVPASSQMQVDTPPIPLPLADLYWYVPFEQITPQPASDDR